MNSHEKSFVELCQWRNALAIKKGKPSFMILNNATLKQTAIQQPRSIDELKKIKGWGEAKIRSFGKDVLSIIKEQDTGNSDQRQVLKSPISDELSVEQCIDLLNAHLQTLTVLKIYGEVSDITRRDRYAFFNLKSQTGEYQVPCFIGWTTYQKYTHLTEEGSHVVIAGRPSLYKNGRLSIDVARIEPRGEGALLKAFETLKIQLSKKGYFDENRKRPIPEDVLKIALITSRHGAAIQDFKKNLGAFGFKIFFSDVFVEGDRAVNSITEAITRINLDHSDCDLIVLIRGGGGLENLKAFNDPQLAGVIVQSRLPVITGIGHEKDVSIADMCADKYLSTPTAVAMFLTQQKFNARVRCEQLSDRLGHNLLNKIQGAEHDYEETAFRLSTRMNGIIATRKIDFKTNCLSLERGTNRIISSIRSINSLNEKIKERTQDLLDKTKTYLNNRREEISNKTIALIRKAGHRVQLSVAPIFHADPGNILKKGYSITRDDKGKSIRSIHEINGDRLIEIQFYDGSIKGDFKEKQKNYEC